MSNLNQVQKTNLARETETKISEAFDPDPVYCSECGKYVLPEEKLLLAIFGAEEDICPDCSEEV